MTHVQLESVTNILFWHTAFAVPSHLKNKSLKGHILKSLYLARAGLPEMSSMGWYMSEL